MDRGLSNISGFFVYLQVRGDVHTNLVLRGATDPVVAFSLGPGGSRAGPGDCPGS